MRWWTNHREAPRTRPARTFLPGAEPSALDPRVLPSNLPAGFSETLVLDTLKSPTSMAFAPDGRLFVTEKNGTIRIVHDGHAHAEPFLKLSVNTLGERGVSSLAFDPDFPNSPYVYVYYTTNRGGVHNRLSRFTASGDHAVAGSEKVLLDLPPARGQLLPVHNGGALHFGPDGKLYLGVGDHYTRPNGQNLRTPMGKILRLNRDGSVPADNPFANRNDGVNRYIWAYGFRNPYTGAFQPGTGRLFINDVGAMAWEEVNDVRAGGNYGWATVEGVGSRPGLIDPIHAYAHREGPDGGCAIVGGTFIPEGGAFPDAQQGQYLYSDFCQGTIRLLDPATGRATNWATGLTGGGVDLDFGPDGALYYLTRTPGGAGGELWRIEHAVNQPPRIAIPPANVTVAAGQPARFRVSASGSEPLEYQWFRDGQEIPGATGPEHTLGATSTRDSGARFQVRLRNAFGEALSPEATLSVKLDQAPVVTIQQPTDGLRWLRGQRISFRASAIDPETGALPASAFSWRVDLHHNEHVHPFLPPRAGRRGSFRIPNSPHDEGVIWYRVTVTVTDRAGLSSTVYRDLYPRAGQV